MNSTRIDPIRYLNGESSKFGKFTATTIVVRHPSYPPPHSELRIIGNTPYGGGAHGVILVIQRSEINIGKYQIAEKSDVTAIYGYGEPSYFDNNGTLEIEAFNSKDQYVKGRFSFTSKIADTTVNGEFEITGFERNQIEHPTLSSD
ncbi:hypothetical protein HNR03_003172 [Pseudomonas sp. JAI111]|uniref:hypothetical protein n=1 Tax=Pseudomonas sp. JAI111 TaxID=2735913 RepID=UPI0021679DFF|nr:hypothetical protein [Pseudomonas sp. JAI111]MCS3838564.1 hypothetical protein [Pseudomonas sp. JAI111]